MYEVEVSLSLVAPSLAILLPVILVCALTYCIVMFCLVQDISWVMAMIGSFSRWCCCNDGIMWLLSRDMLLRLSVIMYVSWWVVCMALMASSMTFGSALRMFWYHVICLLCGACIGVLYS